MTSRFDSAAAAQSAFYSAFEHADFAAMESVWATDDEISCVHPLGHLLLGREAVLGSWRAILNQGPGMRFTVQAHQTIATPDLEILIVGEIIRIPQEPHARPPMIASNAFRRTEAGWRMVSHHASPSPEHFRVATEPATRALH